ncbi:cytolethal distending toxin [Campylobacter fetus subsp. fetus]|uniref:cytolethal distending toxin subunit B family protein n=1 Tax=Campylobacter fetus TaxID=196 RepID=UPI000892AD0C|nr:cytolethal distending toxin subunit B family protein [Campylobacter fetus]EAL3879546.1 cytolethal distending toxin subunit B family protein [Campylobacter fetus]EAL3991789.1 cytolethal distending toxin subunit B family protein [Campylobacter fetus]KAA8734024.1 cytolethal distending toxin subunit B family protein [Campylobacter fetus subsp. fetus]OFI47388.1 cytolethal distending toxin subunit CdtB [Campylobacter fetus subsp. fetus]SQH30280.1 cytolethal distending toxin [Campylobacter fetus s
MKNIYLILFCFSLSFGAIENYNLATWNMQGSSASTESKWNVNVRQLIAGSNAADILFIQEAGSLPHSAVQSQRVVQRGGIPVHEYIWNLGTNSRPNMVYIYYSRVDVGANRVNLAIVSRLQAEEVIVLTPPTTLSRPILGIRIGNDAFFSAHALANGGTDSAAIVENVYRNFISSPNVNWVIGGDFNREPSSLVNILESSVRQRVSIITPNAPTQSSGRTLDYLVAGNSGASAFSAPAIAAILMLANMRSQITSDHIPVNFRRF